jgi:hypothetical protein
MLAKYILTIILTMLLSYSVIGINEVSNEEIKIANP